MDQGFFGSKYFLISAIVAVALIGGAAGAYYVNDTATFHWRGDTSCDAPTRTGTPIEVTPQTSVEDDGERRTTTYSFDAGSYVGGALDLCLAVGEILVEPSSGSRAELEITIEGDNEAAVSATQVPVRFAADGSKLVVAAWESERGVTSGVFDQDSASVRLILRIPASGAYDVRAIDDVGDVHVSDLLVGAFHVETDVGNAIVRGVDLTGDATVISDVGDAILNATSVQSGKIDVRSDVGNAEAELPARADVGYDARASTDVGEATIRIGDTESFDSNGDGAGEDASARSSGFATKPTKVTVRVVTNVGDARITTG